MKPLNCPYCRNPGMHDYVPTYFNCPTCGALYDVETASVIHGLTPEMRAWRAGDYQGRHGDPYLWRMPAFDREELRQYAQAYLSGALAVARSSGRWTRLRACEKQARVDAFSERPFATTWRPKHHATAEEEARTREWCDGIIARVMGRSYLQTGMLEIQE